MTTRALTFLAYALLIGGVAGALFLTFHRSF